MAVNILDITFAILVGLTIWNLTQAAPQFPQRGFQSQKDDESPQPYDFQYKIDNPASRTIFGQSEAGDSQGKVIGSYYVLLPDGRLMNVEYSVDGESGFVPKITFTPQNAPGTPVPPRIG
ncbi:pro-resilin [Dendroctonus ponderosae]